MLKKDNNTSENKARRRIAAVSAAAAVLITLLIATIIIIAAITVSNIISTGKGQDTDNSITSGADTGPLEPDDTEETSAEEASTTEEPSGTDTSPQIPTGYDFSQPVPQSEPVSVSYFDDALFIGDSRTEGFRMYAGITNAQYYATKGLMASTTFTTNFIEPTSNMTIPDDFVPDESHEGKLTVTQALEFTNRFGKIYIMLGVNELGWLDANAFITQYKRLIEVIREHHPSACIYIQLIMPVSAEKSASDPVYNNERINMFNGLIIEMCKSEQLFYINTPESVADENGNLPKEAGVDGVHMNRSYCEQWRDYLLSHTISN